MKITPMRDCIFVLPDEVIDKTEGGVVLSDYTKKRPTTGTVISVGPKVTEVKEGNRVLYGQYSGSKEHVELNGKKVELYLMTEGDIIAVEETTDCNHPSV